MFWLDALTLELLLHGGINERPLTQLDGLVCKGLHILFAVNELPLVLRFVLSPHLEHSLDRLVGEEGFSLSGAWLSAFEEAAEKR